MDFLTPTTALSPEVSSLVRIMNAAAKASYLKKGMHVGPFLQVDSTSELLDALGDRAIQGTVRAFNDAALDGNPEATDYGMMVTITNHLLDAKRIINKRFVWDCDPLQVVDRLVRLALLVGREDHNPFNLRVNPIKYSELNAVAAFEKRNDKMGPRCVATR